MAIQELVELLLLYQLLFAIFSFQNTSYEMS
jgi:hypothetical protein